MKQVGGDIKDACLEPNRPDCLGSRVYAIEMSNEQMEDKFNCSISPIKIDNTGNITDKIIVNFYINSKNPTISFKIDPQDNIPGFAVPVSLLDSNNILKKVNFRLIHGNNKFNVHFIYIQNVICDDSLDFYALFIPIIIKNIRDKYSIKHSSYSIIINRNKLTFFCPKIIVNKVSTIYKPFFILPRRIYPICVYIEAILLYLSGNMTQRQVAEAIRNKFSIDNFSASTVSRIINSSYKDILEHDPSFIINNVVNIVNIDSMNIPQKNKFNSIRKLQVINIVLNSLPEEVFYDDQILNFKSFSVIWFQKFSKHFLISSARSNLYSIP